MTKMRAYVPGEVKSLSGRNGALDYAMARAKPPVFDSEIPGKLDELARLLGVKKDRSPGCIDASGSWKCK